MWVSNLEFTPDTINVYKPFFVNFVSFFFIFMKNKPTGKLGSPTKARAHYCYAYVSFSVAEDGQNEGVN